MFGLPSLADAVVRAVVLTMVMLAWIILLVRIIGLRAFSKMTAFDFIVTLATGSLLATGATSSGWPAFVQAMTAATVLLVTQYLLAWLRRSSSSAATAIGNEPLLLMRDGDFVDAALAEGRVMRDDVIAKLREANALQLSSVSAVILETTGDISVLHGGNLDARLLDGVRDLRDGRER